MERETGSSTLHRAASPTGRRSRNLERAGVLRSTAMEMVGHKTESIYRCYDQLPMASDPMRALLHRLARPPHPFLFRSYGQHAL
jgi:hypothetical protein